MQHRVKRGNSPASQPVADGGGEPHDGNGSQARHHGGKRPVHAGRDDEHVDVVLIDHGCERLDEPVEPCHSHVVSREHAHAHLAAEKRRLFRGGDVRCARRQDPHAASGEPDLKAGGAYHGRPACGRPVHLLTPRELPFKASLQLLADPAEDRPAALRDELAGDGQALLDALAVRKNDLADPLPVMAGEVGNREARHGSASFMLPLRKPVRSTVT